jgi:hypothetical protein
VETAAPAGTPFTPVLAKVAVAAAGLALLVFAGFAGSDRWSTRASPESDAAGTVPVADAPVAAEPVIETREASGTAVASVGEPSAALLPEPPKPATPKVAHVRAKAEPARAVNRTAANAPRSRPTLARAGQEKPAVEAPAPVMERIATPAPAAEEPAWLQPPPPLNRHGAN